MLTLTRLRPHFRLHRDGREAASFWAVDEPVRVTPPRGWDLLSVAEVCEFIPRLKPPLLAAMRAAELEGRNRKTLLAAIDRQLNAAPAELPAT